MSVSFGGANRVGHVCLEFLCGHVVGNQNMRAMMVLLICLILGLGKD